MRNKPILHLILSFLFGAILSTLIYLFLPYEFNRVFWASLLLNTIGIFLLIRLWQWSEGGKIIGIFIISALLLRLGLAILFSVGLPVWGYDTETQNAGYLFRDAYERDSQSWQLASSDQPIWKAFTSDFFADQYGGLLAFSSIVYRFLSPEIHNNFLIILIASFFSTAAIPFLWKASFRFQFRARVISAAIISFYPDVLLFSISQMREPFLLGLSAILFWIVNDEREINLKKIILFSTISFFILLISTRLFFVIIPAMLLWFFVLNPISKTKFLKNRWISALLIFLFLIIGIFSFLWILRAGNWDTILLEQSSGWIQKIFSDYGKGIRIPFATVYGLLQPVLPAAIVEPSIPLWKAIAIIRSLSWYLLLPIFLYGFVFCLRQPKRKRYRYLVIWGLLLFWLIISSLRAGGDLWDNPRYRINLFILMAAFIGLVLDYGIHHRDHWIWRIFASEFVFVLIFLEWYISRYTNLFGKMDFLPMIALIFVLVAIIVIWGIIVEIRNSHRQKNA